MLATTRDDDGVRHQLIDRGSRLGILVSTLLVDVDNTAMRVASNFRNHGDDTGVLALNGGKVQAPNSRQAAGTRGYPDDWEARTDHGDSLSASQLGIGAADTSKDPRSPTPTREYSTTYISPFTQTFTLAGSPLGCDLRQSSKNRRH